MPVLFVLDPEILKAKNMKTVWDITLNYTFFASIDQNTYNFDYGQTNETESKQTEIKENTILLEEAHKLA